MRIQHLTAVICLVAAMEYANANSTPATGFFASQIETNASSGTSTTMTSAGPPNTNRSCLYRLQNNPIASSSRRFLAVPKRGQRRAFASRFPHIYGEITIVSGAGVLPPVAIVTADQANEVANDSTIERIEVDAPVCVDILDPDPEPDTSLNRSRRSFDPDELCWNIDRIDERELPLDGQYCPAADGTSVDVYILDSGINYDHQVFGGRARSGGYDQFGGDGRDCHGHGTHCAGLAVGRLTGVAWGAQVFSIRVLDCQLGGFFSYVISGINHVIDRARVTGRRTVISMSLIGPITEAINVAIREAVANNIVVVTAAGNFRGDSCGYSPSSSPDVINVGGIQEAEDTESRFSGHMLYWFNSRPNSPGSNYGRCVDIFAPGQWIRSASHTSNIDRVSMSGTSMACPTTAGVVATLLQRFPNYTPRQIKDRLLQESTINAINMRTYRGGSLPQAIVDTTPNSLVYTGRCSGNSEPITDPPTPDPTDPPPTTPPQLPGCLFDGILHDHGTTITPNCSAECQCNSGTLECQTKKCYVNSCHAYTYGHYHTFDGTSYDYQGTCEHVLVRPCNNIDFTISVVHEALNSGRVEVRRVLISFESTNIVFQSGENSIMINDVELQRFDGNMRSIGEVLVQWIGGNAHATFEDKGIDLFWDGSNSFQISVSDSLRTQLCGLCGFYNGDPSDDLRMPDGSIAVDINNFAFSWLRDGGNSNDMCRPARNTSNPICSTQNLRFADETCSILNSAPFDMCHSEINPQPYIGNCINDFCNCSGTSNSQREACSCDVIAAYARACAQAGIGLEDWRTTSACSADCSGIRQYLECGSLCQLTCSNYQSPTNCSKDCAPGCFCSGGQVLKGGQCVDPDTCDDPPSCKGTCLPTRPPFYFERFYLSELDYFINLTSNLSTVPSHITVYRDDSDLLFAMVFRSIKNASHCRILTSATAIEVNQLRRSLKSSHRILTTTCYLDDENKSNCIAVFCPREQECDSIPTKICRLGQQYRDYQITQLRQQARGFRVIQRKLYFKGDDLVVDVCYQRDFSVSLHDAVDLSTLVQVVERNEQRGLYLADGNARLVGTEMVYSAVFTTQRFGNCDYRVIYNVDALQLFERERSLATQGFHITAIIPTTGSLTPLFIAVFWR